MTCKGILDTLSDYLEGDTADVVCNEIEEHLNGCEKCRMHVDTMRAIVTLYKGWRGDTIPDDVSGRLQEVIAETAGLSSRKPSRPTVSTSAKRGESAAKPKKKPAAKPRKKPRRRPGK